MSGSDLTDCPCVRKQQQQEAQTAVPNANLPCHPSPLHTHRPIHLMRQPSINPPSFYDDVAPPPLLTPPPNYDDLTPRVEVRDGYFDHGSESNTDVDEELEDEEVEQVTPPRTPVSEEVQIDAEEDNEEIEEEGDIVDMVGLEDLSLNVGSPVQRRSVDGIGLWS